MLRAIKEKAIADYKANETESVKRLAAIFAEAFTPLSESVTERLDRIEDAIKLLLERELDEWSEMPTDKGATLEELIKVVKSANRRESAHKKRDSKE